MAAGTYYRHWALDREKMKDLRKLVQMLNMAASSGQLHLSADDATEFAALRNSALGEALWNLRNHKPELGAYQQHYMNQMWGTWQSLADVMCLEPQHQTPDMGHAACPQNQRKQTGRPRGRRRSHSSSTQTPNPVQGGIYARHDTSTGGSNAEVHLHGDVVQTMAGQGGQLCLRQSVYGGNKLNLQFGTPPGDKPTVPEAAAAKQHTAKNGTRATGLQAMHEWNPDARTTSWDGPAAVRKELERRLAEDKTAGEGLEMHGLGKAAIAGHVALCNPSDRRWTARHVTTTVVTAQTDPAFFWEGDATTAVIVFGCPLKDWAVHTCEDEASDSADEEDGVTKADGVHYAGRIVVVEKPDTVAVVPASEQDRTHAGGPQFLMAVFQYAVVAAGQKRPHTEVGGNTSAGMLCGLHHV